jgi:hypothetical protein
MSSVKATPAGKNNAAKLTNSGLFIWTSGHKNGDSKYNIKVLVKFFI